MRNRHLNNIVLRWRRFKKIQSARYAFYFIVLLSILSIFSDYLASEKPLIQDAEKNAWMIAPIPWSPNQADPLNRDYTGPFDEQKFKLKENTIIPSPFRYRHHLGTDAAGNDLLSGIIHATSVSLRIGLISMLLAGFIGISLGAVAGYFGNRDIMVSRSEYWAGLFGLALGFFRITVAGKTEFIQSFSMGPIYILLELLTDLLILFAPMVVMGYLGRMLHRINFLKKKISIPVDTIIQGIAGIFSSVPNLVIIIAVASIYHQKGVGIITAIIGLTCWPGVYRLARAEMMKVRNMPYIEAAKTFGLPDAKILVRHAIPNAMTPVMIELVFLIPAAIIAESSLSFLGIGMPDHIITWGSLLSKGRQQFDAWWIVVFPGLAIFLTTLAFHLIGNGLKRMNKYSDE